MALASSPAEVLARAPKRPEAGKIRRRLRQLQALGLDVTITPAAA